MEMMAKIGGFPCVTHRIVMRFRRSVLDCRFYGYT